MESALLPEYYTFSRDLDNLFVESGRRSHVIWRLDGSFGGLRAVSKEIVNPPGGGTEGIWAEPLRLADFVHFHLWDDAEGLQAVERNAKGYTRRVGLSEIEYRFGAIPGLSALKRVWVPLASPAVVVELLLRSELDQEMPLRLFADFQSHLSIGWPLREGGRNTAAYDPALPGIVAHDETHPEWTALCAVSLVPEAVHTGSFTPVLVGGGTLPRPAGGTGAPDRGRSCMQLSVTVPADGETRLAVVVSGSRSSEADAREVSRTVMTGIERLREEKVSHYRRIFEGSAVLESPSYAFNKAFLWAKLGTEDFKHDDPKLGFLFFAGYPAYNFYFASDSMLILRASLAIGDFEDAVRMLRTIVRYQATTRGRDTLPGEIWHEMSTTGDRISPNFVGFLFPGLLRAFYDWTGDKALLDEMYPHARAVVAWGYGMDTNGDGLLENGPEGEMADSASEDRNVERSHYHVQVQWLDALREGARLAELVGDTGSVTRWTATAEALRPLVNGLYWNEKERSFHETLRPDGCMDTSAKGLSNPDTGMVDEGKAVATTRLLLEEESYITDTAAFQARKAFEQTFSTHRSYMSWYVMVRGVRALQLYRAHFPDPAFRALEAIAGSPFHWTTPGLWPEVWAVDEPGTLRVRGCFHQAWTGSHGFIYPLVEGLLGLRPDAPNRALTFAPHLPDSWPRVALRRLRLGAGWFDVECTQEEGRRRLFVRNESADALRVTFDFVLPLSVRVVRLEVNGIDQELSVLRARATHGDIHAVAEAAAPPGAECSAGLWWEPADLVVRVVDDVTAPGGAAPPGDAAVEEQGPFLARTCAGSTRSIAVEVFNSGHQPVAAELRMEVPAGWVLDPPSPRSLAVEPDDAARFTTSVAVPASAEGYYTLRVWLSSSESGLWSSATAYLPVFPSVTANLDGRQVARSGVPFKLRVDAVNLSASARDVDPRVEWPAGWKGPTAAHLAAVAAGESARATLSAVAGPAGDGEISVSVGSPGEQARVLRHSVRVVPRGKPLVLFSGFLACPLPADPGLEVVSLPANYALRKPHVFEDLLPLSDLILTSDQHDAVFTAKQVDAMAAFVENGGKLLLYCSWSAPWGRGFHDTFGSIATGHFPEILPLRMRKGIHHARRVSVTPEGRDLLGGLAWHTVPPFDHNEAEARDGARVLAVSETGAPLAAEWKLGKGKVMAISIDCFGFESYVEGLSFDFWAERPRMFLQAVKGLLAPGF